MEILNSGSFITLDNRDKIERLIFTAKELAQAAIATNGFVSTPATNQSLALQMWQGAEYVTREHEEATIKNIFLSNFLQQLRDLAKRQTQQVSPVATIANGDRAEAPTPSTAGASGSDEFLGLVESNESDPNETGSSYSEECRPPGEVELTSVGEDQTCSGEIESATAPTESLTEGPEALEEPVISPDTDNKQIDTPAESTGNGFKPELVESIVLAEKEPYNFDSCTVTAVVQLLPVQGETRKCVVSIRTHDFTPQIIISELRAGQFTDDVLKALGGSYSQYRNDLPARSAEKLKKEKTAGKKRSAKSAEPANPSAGSDAKARESATNGASTGQVAATEIAAKDQGSLFAGS